jgi:hypothetical protein
MKREQMKLLRHIARENALVRALPLSPWERLCDDFDHRIEAQLYQSSLRRQRNAQRELSFSEQRREIMRRVRNQKW